MTDDSNDDLENEMRSVLEPPAAEPAPERVADLRAVVAAAGAPAPATPSSLRFSPRRKLAIAALVAAAVVVGGVSGAVIEHRVADDSTLVARGSAEFEAELAGADVEVALDGRAAPEGRIVILRSENLPVLPAGEYYELWFAADEDDPGQWISAGTFHPDEDGRTRVVLHAAVDPRLVDQVEITRETAAGGPAPSGDVVAQGAVDLLR